MHFVDEINLVSPFGRRVAHVVAQFAHVFDAVVARAVDLDDIETVAAGNLACSYRILRMASRSAPSRN